MTVRQLGYLEFDVTDLDAWHQLLTGVLGCDVEGEPSAGELTVRIDARHHRFVLRAAPDEAIRRIGWEVADERALEELAKRLTSLGHEVQAGTESECEERAVRELVRVHDPVGLEIELCTGAVVGSRPPQLTCGVNAFNGDELGLGHIVLLTRKHDEAQAFYRDVLGFRVSDYITINGMGAVFFHCNPRHHSLALVDVPDLPADATLAHFLLEVSSLDDVGSAYDRCLNGGVPIVLSLGRHTNDLMMSFYLRTPSGFEVEYGFGGRLVDPDGWTVQTYDSPSRWGHRPIASERITP